MTLGSRHIDMTVLVEDSAGIAGSMSEHGFSLFVETETDTILFDTGQGAVLEHNANLLKRGLEQPSLIIVSHGHYDHAGGLPIAARRSPASGLIIHPLALYPKYAADGRYIGMSDEALEVVKKHKRVMFTEDAAEVVPGVFVSGTVVRHTDFESPKGQFFRDREFVEEDAMEDDMSAALLTDKGLIIISGCAHSGIVNSVDHMKQVTGCNEVLAVIGGFHLGGASMEKIDKTVQGLKDSGAQYVCAGHCTGENALNKLQKAFGKSFIRLSPGRKLSFH